MTIARNIREEFDDAYTAGIKSVEELIKHELDHAPQPMKMRSVLNEIDHVTKKFISENKLQEAEACIALAIFHNEKVVLEYKTSDIFQKIIGNNLVIARRYFSDNEDFYAKSNAERVCELSRKNSSQWKAGSKVLKDIHLV